MSENYREECDGQWSSWSDWPVCPETCGDHTLTSTRTCTQGRLGADCEGESNRTKECSNQPCPGWNSIIIIKLFWAIVFKQLMGNGETGLDGDLVPSQNVEANKQEKQEVATILLLLMVGLPALAIIVKLKVLCFCAFYTHLMISLYLYISILFNWLDCGPWTLYGGNCYRRVGTKRTWVKARNNCQNVNATLVSIPDEETENFLKNRLSYGVPFWTGGKPCSAGSNSWCWLDETPFSFTNWRDSCPKDGNDQRIFVNGEWCTFPYDDLEHEYASICQYEYDPDDLEE